MLAKVIKLIKETHDSCTVRFDANLNFVPGQFVMIEPKIPGVEKSTQRAFSVSSSPTKKYLEITAKALPDGFVSQFLFKELKVGDKMNITGPFGHFVFKDSDKEVVLLGAGSGVTPYRCILQYIVDKGLKTKVVMIDSQKTPEDLIYKKELDKFDKLANFKIIHTITRPETSKTKWSGLTGRIDINPIKKNCDLSSTFFLCGPPVFVRSMESLLKEAGVPAKRIKKEVYG